MMNTKSSGDIKISPNRKQRLSKVKKEFTYQKNSPIVKNFKNISNIVQHLSTRKELRQLVSKLKNDLLIEKDNVHVQNTNDYYLSLINKVDSMIISLGLHGDIVFINEKSCSFFNHKQNYFIGKSFIKLFPLSEQNNIDNAISKVCTGITNNYIVKYSQKILELNFAPLIKFNNVEGIVITLRDITSSRNLESKYKDSERILSLVTDNMTTVIYAYNMEKKLIYVNDTIEDLTGFNKDYLYKNNFLNNFFPKDKNRIITKWKNVFLGKEFYDEYRIITYEGKVKWCGALWSPMYDDHKIQIGVHGREWDITQRKSAEIALRESEERFRNMADTAPVMIWMSGSDSLFYYFNNTWLKFRGKTLVEESGHQWIESIHKLDLDKYKKIFSNAYAKQSSFSLEYRLKRNDGKYRWLLDNGQPRFDKDRNFSGFIGSCIDITDQKKAEVKLKKSLEIKEILLREIHHRVKNNLQIVSSLLSLQSLYTHDTKYQSIFTESQNRIRSMSFIHERLYRSSDLINIDYKKYITNIVETLTDIYGVNKDKIKISINVDKIILGIDHAVPCGLIINELVSNSFKYAFKGKEMGSLIIEFHKKENIYSLVVQDDGIGMPKKFNINNCESLGLELVKMLSEQIKGNLIIKNENGTRFEILFPK
ncbi:MAG: PAS domain S-box protein [bacterium]